MKEESIHIQMSRVLLANKEGSFGTQAVRHDILMMSMTDLHSLGYANLKLTNLKPKHITALVNDWKIQGIANATMKNRLSHLRWLVQKIDKANIIPRTNKELGIDNRVYLDNSKNKAWELTNDQLDSISSERVRLSLQLERVFGLRKEESLKFQPDYADKGDHIELMGSWCKNGRNRIIPVTTKKQRKVLNACHCVAGKGSMIPPDKSYVQWLSSFESYCSRAGIKNVHGLRHKYAQELYKILTGWECPKNGGMQKKDMTPEQKEIDRKVRLEISNNLGHGREKITAIYLGR